MTLKQQCKSNEIRQQKMKTGEEKVYGGGGGGGTGKGWDGRKGERKLAAVFISMLI